MSESESSSFDGDRAAKVQCKDCGKRFVFRSKDYFNYESCPKCGGTPFRYYQSLTRILRKPGAKQQPSSE